MRMHWVLTAAIIAVLSLTAWLDAQSVDQIDWDAELASFLEGTFEGAL